MCSGWPPSRGKRPGGCPEIRLKRGLKILGDTPITDTSPLSRSTEGSLMIDRVSPSTPPETPAVPQHVSSPRSVARKDEFKLEPADKLPGGVPKTPPPEVLYALDRAQSVLAELASRQVSMRISVDEETDRIHVALYDGEGRLIREVPPEHATAMLSGERPVGWLSR